MKKVYFINKYYIILYLLIHKKMNILFVLFVGCEKVKKELEKVSNINLVNEKYDCIVACPPNIEAKQKAQDEKIPYYECGIAGHMFHIEPTKPFISSTQKVYCSENN